MKHAIVIASAFLLTAASALVYVSYKRDLDAAHVRVSTGSEIVQTPCGPIEYAIVGKGPPILVIHGAGGGFDQGLDFGRGLAERGFRIVAVSRFGYLRTPMPADGSPMAQAGAHVCLLDALNIDSAVVMGASAGAPSAMQLCLRNPRRCKGLVLLVPLAYAERLVGESAPQPSHFAQFVINTTLRSDFVYWLSTKLAHDSLVESILATPLADVKKAGPEEIRRLGEVLDHVEPISARAAGLRNDGAIAQSIERYELERFTIPTLVASAQNDRFHTWTGARYTAAHIPGARFVGFPTGGHLLVGHQAEITAELAEFLDRVLASPVGGVQ